MLFYWLERMVFSKTSEADPLELANDIRQNRVLLCTEAGSLPTMSQTI
jgi:hypothetical protein